MPPSQEPPTYITCRAKKAEPRLSPQVCLKCIRRSRCRDYLRFVQPALFPEEDMQPLPSPRLGTHARASAPLTPPGSKPRTPPTQLRLDFEE